MFKKIITLAIIIMMSMSCRSTHELKRDGYRLHDYDNLRLCGFTNTCLHNVGNAARRREPLMFWALVIDTPVGIVYDLVLFPFLIPMELWSEK